MRSTACPTAASFSCTFTNPAWHRIQDARESESRCWITAPASLRAFARTCSRRSTLPRARAAPGLVCGQRRESSRSTKARSTSSAACGPAEPEQRFRYSYLSSSCSESWTYPSHRLSNRASILQQKAGRSARLFVLRKSALLDVEVLLVQHRIALHQDRLSRQIFHFGDELPVIGLEDFGDLGAYAQCDIGTIVFVDHLAHLDVNLVAHGRNRLHKARPNAVRAGFAQSALLRLLNPLSRDRHEAEIVELEHL